MSMRDYAVQDYGLVFEDTILKTIAEKNHIGEYEKEGYSNPRLAFNADFHEDPYGFLGEIEDKLGLSYLGNFTGDAFKITDNGGRGAADVISYSDEIVYYLPLKKVPSLFKPAYSSVDEIIEEVKAAVGAYLPEEFDYRNNIREIIGTTFG